MAAVARDWGNLNRKAAATLRAPDVFAAHRASRQSSGSPGVNSGQARRAPSWMVPRISGVFFGGHRLWFFFFGALEASGSLGVSGGPFWEIGDRHPRGAQVFGGPPTSRQWCPGPPTSFQRATGPMWFGSRTRAKALSSAASGHQDSFGGLFAQAKLAQGRSNLGTVYAALAECVYVIFTSKEISVH